MRYRELYPNTVTGEGLIYELSNLESIPWYNISDDEKRNLELSYYVRSGFKVVIDTYAELPANTRAKIIQAFFQESWKKIWDDYKLEYKANEGYTMVENRNENKERTLDDDITYGRVISENSTDTGTVGTTQNTQTNGQENVFGFNSQSNVPSNSDTETLSDNINETRNLAGSRTSNNSGADERDIHETNADEYSSTKKGNIGYQSPQRLIKDDIELWSTPFFQRVFADIDSFFTILIY